MVAERKMLKKIYDDVEFFKHQVDGIRDMARMSSFILADDMGLGKLLTLNTSVLTPHGYVAAKEVQVGDLLIGVDGLPHPVMGVYPQGLQPIVRVTFNDGVSCDVSWDHLWCVQHVRNDRAVRYPNTHELGLPPGKWRVLTTREIIDTVRDNSGNLTWRVPLVAPVQFEPTPLPDDPYLVGVVLGDGCHRGGGAWSVCTDLEILEDLGASSIRPHHTSTKVKTGTLFVQDLPGGRSWEKRIPVEYLYSSPEDRLALLRGLMDTDGYPMKDGGNEFCSTSENLVDGVIHLVQSLGGVARNKTDRITHYTYKGEYKDGRQSWRVNVKMPVGMAPFRLQRKLDAYIEPTKYPPRRLIESAIEIEPEQAVCFRVDSPSNLYVINDFIVTHNTLQALTVSAIDFERKWAEHILVVCPAFLKWNWMEEIEQFTSFTATVYHGTPRVREEQIKNFNSEILIVGYRQLSIDFDLITSLPWDIMIVDEAHYIANPKSAQTRAVHAVAVNRSFLLTGSPVLNRPNELWSLLHRCDAVRFKKYYTFVQRYCVFGGFKNKQIVGTKNKLELRGIIGEYLIRRLKDDVLDLPGKQVIPVYVDLHPEQKKAYDQITKDLALVIPATGDPMAIENALVKMLKQKQVAATPFTVGLPDDSYKLDRAIEMVKEFTTAVKFDAEGNAVGVGEPVVIFTQFRGVMEAMQIRLDAIGVPLWQLHGDIPMQKRIESIKAWSTSLVPGVMMVSLKMATGMNLTAASKEIFLDKLYVPKLNEQAEDRCYRIGQSISVQVFCLISRGTVEERIERILKSKQQLFKTLIEDVSSWKAALMAELAKDEV